MTAEQKHMVLICAILATLAESKSAPSGTLYAAVMGKCDLNTYLGTIQMLTDAGRIKVSGDLVTYVEPEPGSKAAQLMHEICKLYDQEKAKGPKFCARCGSERGVPIPAQGTCPH
jgi:hypothetical protein